LRGLSILGLGAASTGVAVIGADAASGSEAKEVPGSKLIDGRGSAYIDSRLVFFDVLDAIQVPGAAYVIRNRNHHRTYLTVERATMDPMFSEPPKGFCNIDHPDLTARSGYPCVRQLPIVGLVVGGVAES
jgi:hypothetical protein